MNPFRKRNRALLIAAVAGLMLTGCFDKRNIDMGVATAAIPKPYMQYKVGEYAIQSELYLYSRLNGFDFYIGMVDDTYDNGESYRKKAEELGTDRYYVTQGEEGQLYFEGMVFNEGDRAVLLTCEYGDPSMQDTLEEIFNSIQFKSSDSQSSESADAGSPSTDQEVIRLTA